jgi:phage-related minor tail protein
MAFGKGREVIVSILGDASGLNKAFGDADKAAQSFGDKVGSLGGTLTKTLTPAAVAIGAFAKKAGDEWNSATDTIRVGTGATGAALDALKADFKAVVSSVPTDFKSAGTAVADLNTRLGLTGQELRIRSQQFLELSRITGTDVASNIASVTRVFGDWGVETDKQTDTMNMLFRASQSTGIGVDKLSEQLVTFGAPMRELGFDMDTTAVLLGKFEKEGVNAELVMGGLKQGLGRLTKAGKDPQAELRNLMKSIDDVGLTAENKAKVFEMFGARAGIDMAKAMEEGRFAISDLLDTVTNGQETIMGAASDTIHWSDKLTMLKNSVMATVGPYGEMGMAIAGVAAGIGPMLSMVPALRGAFMGLNAVIAANPIVFLVIAIAALVAGLVWAYNNVEWFRDGVQAAFGAIVNAAQWLGRVFAAIWDGIVAGFRWVTDTIKSRINWVIGLINQLIAGVNSVTGGLNKIPGVSLPTFGTIPQLAKGGIVSSPTLALIAEAGPGGRGPARPLQRRWWRSAGRGEHQRAGRGS